MKITQSTAPYAFAIALAVGGLVSAQETKPLAPSQQVAPEILVQRIEVNCLTSKNAQAYNCP